MNIIQFRPSGSPVPKDAAISFPADLVIFTPAPRLSGQQRLERLHILDQLAADWSLTRHDVLSFFGGGPGA